MKPLAAALLFVWFGLWTEAGYQMTQDGFAWVDEPNFGLAIPEGRKAVPRFDLDLNAIKAVAPKPGQDLDAWFADLSADKRRCLTEAVGPARASEILKTGGTQTPEETLRLLKCLE